MNTSSHIILHTQGGIQYQTVPGETLRLLAEADTNGAYTAFEVRNAPEAGPLLHFHPDIDETFYVLTGPYSFQIGPEQVTATDGTFLRVPRGMPHAYRYDGDTEGRLLALFNPAWGEAFFSALDQLSKAGIPPFDEQTVALAAAHNVQLAGPPPSRNGSEDANGRSQ